MVKIETNEMITLTTAAKIRGVTHQAILNLIKRGKLTVVEIDSVKFLRRDEIENYQPSKAGRPRRQIETSAEDATDNKR